MYRVEDPVFAMAESFFLDGGGRLDDVNLEPLSTVSGRRSVTYPQAGAPDVGRCRLRALSGEGPDEPCSTGALRHRFVLEQNAPFDPCQPPSASGSRPSCLRA